MNLKLSCPSKTFLIGEYAALEGAPALIVNTQPRFELILHKTGRSLFNIFHAKSPAGMWIKERAPLLEGWELTFIDPHSGKGGLGASSAQFLLSHCATTFLQISASQVREGFDLKAVWNDYMVLTKNSSGYDVLAQAVGQIAHVETQNWILQGLAWPFPGLHFVIVRTGSKTATHKHLQEVNSEKFVGLGEVSREACMAFENQNEELFLNMLKKYSSELESRNLVSPETLQKISSIEKSLPLKMARGCGALGTDTMLLLFTPNHREQVVDHLQKQGLAIIAESLHLSAGLETEWSWDKA